jgi:hypothetical protein
MKVINSGDLAYLPSNVTLISFDRKGVIRKATMTYEPSVVLVTKIDTKKGYEIIYKGSQWYVSEKSIYPVDANDYKEQKNVGNFNGSL